MKLEKILKVTQAQYATLADGGTVGTESGLDEKALYLTNVSFLDSVYPIGSIYMSVRNVSPAEFFGGTWVPFGVSLMLRSADSSVDPSRVSKDGGNDDLTIPSHRHYSSHGHGTHTHSWDTGVVYSNVGNHLHQWNATNSGTGGLSKDQNYTWGGSYPRFNNGASGTGYSGAHSHTFSVGGTSGGSGDISYTGNTSVPHPSSSRVSVVEDGTGLNLPVYKSVYMWMRVPDSVGA